MNSVKARSFFTTPKEAWEFGLGMGNLGQQGKFKKVPSYIQIGISPIWYSPQ